jgi:2-desacetyl-2-hydroxyethyl bacteriochlorophyllide A dehydrogenase
MESSAQPNTRIVFREPFDLHYHDEAIPGPPGSGQVLVRNRFSLVSPGTELALYTGTHVSISNPLNTFAKYPFRPGYATIGEVIAVGEGVDGMAAGDTVYTRGQHARYNVLRVDDPAGPVLRLDPAGRPEEMVFARLAAISMTAIGQALPRIGDTCVVIGMGLIGNLAAQLMEIAGARVVAVDVVEGRLKAARECGLNRTLLSTPATDVRSEACRLLDAEAIDVVVEATGAPQLVGPALEIVRPLGAVVALGSTRGTVDIDVYELIHRKGVRLLGAHEMIQMQPGFPSKLAMTRHVLAMLERGALKIAPLITHRLPYSDAKRAYEMLRDPREGALGVLLEWA